MRAKGKISVASQGQQYNINAADLDFDVEETDERPMGTSRTHIARTTVTNKGKELEVVISVEEYPQGQPNEPTVSIDDKSGSIASNDLTYSF
jgi:hypothetical protein